MTSIPVKDVGSAFMNLAVSQAAKSTANAGGFQQVWNNRVNSGTADKPAADAAARSDAGRQLQRGSSLKARTGRAAESDEAVQSDGELSPEEAEQAAEVLGAAALELMQQIADAFGISMEELQDAMDAMGLEQTDILDVSQLGALLLNLDGAEDSYALLTDGELYETYRALMDQLEGIVKESADVLGMEPEQLGRILEEGFGKTVSAEEQPGEMPSAVPEEPAEQYITEEPVTSAIPGEPVSEEQESVNQNGDQPKGEEKAFEGKSEKEEPAVLFVQNLRTQQFQPDLQQTGSVSQSSSWSAETQKIMEQILDYMKVQLGSDVTSLEMQLHPASLGTLQIQIASKAGVVTANFITQNEAVKAALESQMVQLKEQFEEQGVKVEAIEVTVQTHEFERNLDEQGRGRGGQEPGKKNRTRRVNLNASLMQEGLEEEEALAADMLAAGGSTVDYTA